ncbi:MAG: hypothetical protein QY318_04370 [Candidatus Dojkabacteria bacterium]|nr:MAG: hypothetical protein QY318_04370 [Candidatus Dojkabacteria bacterium]
MNTDLLIARTIIVLTSTVGYLFIAALLWKFAPVKLKVMSDKLGGLSEAVSSLIVGLIAIPVAIVAAIMFLFTFVGWPVVLIMLGFFIVFTQICFPVVGYSLGRRVVPKAQIFWQMAAGILLLELIALIPAVGEFIWFVVFCLTIGAAFRMKGQFMSAK